MTETYSTYDAKAKLSEILRKVEKGRTIYITRRGERIAEVRPVGPEPVTLEQRIIELTERGVIVPAADPTAVLRPVAHRPGALARFLADRNE